MTGAALTDLFRNLKVGLSDILKQLGQSRSGSRVFLEKQLLKHRLVDGDHLPEMGSVEVHDGTSSVSPCSGSPPVVLEVHLVS
jgi:hypothetical protein